MIWILVIVSLAVGFGAGFLVGRQAKPAAPDLFDQEGTIDDPRTVAARLAIQSRTEMRLKRILEKAQADGKITNNGVEELFCISDRTASVYLGELTQRGDLERKGAGRGTFYVPKKG